MSAATTAARQAENGPLRVVAELPFEPTISPDLLRAAVQAAMARQQAEAPHERGAS